MGSAIPDFSAITEGISCPVITFGETKDSDYSATDISYDDKGCASFTLLKKGEPAGSYTLQVPGAHNISNALAAIALADLLGIDSETVRNALASFSGTDRRFEYKGVKNGITIIDDYAHHPTEITATLKAAANYPHKTLWCVFQPHTYTRTKAFMKDFAKALSLADRVILAKIYPARETDNLGISSDNLREEIEALGKSCHYFSEFSEIQKFILENCQPGDLLITMGAGDVVKIGENLLK
jgi:UDP-N-acetylmuramate--alanine ligase